MDLQALRNRSARVRFEFDGETLTFDYNPHAYDDECQRIVHRMSDAEDNSELAQVFEKLITSWDMKDAGTIVPCNYENFMKLPPFLRTKILSTIIDDEMELGKLRSSGNSSNRPAPQRSGLVQIGSQQSTPASTQDGQTGATT